MPCHHNEGSSASSRRPAPDEVPTLASPTAATVALISLVLVCALCAPSLGQQEPRTEAEELAESRLESSSELVTEVPRGRGHGAVIYVDPETGELTNESTPAQRLALSLLARQQDQQRIRRDGTDPSARIRYFAVPGGIGAYLDGAFQSSLRVHRGEDGTFHFGCTETHPDHSTDDSLAGVPGGSGQGTPRRTAERAPIQ